MSGLNDVSDAFDGWLETITGVRSSGGYIDGRWAADAPVALSFSGVVQNATPDDLKVLGEGERTEEAIKIHTAFKLVPQIGTTNTGDILTYDGNTWLVYNVAHRNIGSYHKAIAIRCKQ
jgi:hypothetical protein